MDDDRMRQVGGDVADHEDVTGDDDD